MTVKKTTAATVSAPKNQGIRMPTEAELVSAYRSIANAAEKNGSAKHLKNAPAGWQKAPSYNITMKGLLGVSKMAYVIKGEIYVKTSVLSPTAKPSWEKIGPAPMF